MSGCIAIIPARGGSKRIPRKNIRLFHGQPMIAYSIRAALDSGLFDRVVVSTDDAEIAAVARECGAEIPFVRPDDLSDDYATSMSVVQHAIRALQEQGAQMEFTCCIYATAPFVRPSFLAEGLARLQANPNASYAFSVTRFPFPVQRGIRINRMGRVEALQPEYRFTRSQDLEEAYHDAAQFYWGRTEAWAKDDLLFSELSIPIVLPRYLVQDIDTVEDWKCAELIYTAIAARDNLP
ncbi:pseudaminic acid cytidylyltransferase [Chitinilyticum piscinae]|uniref:Pseudaminic acid cytidylyltransferase n=1 Tax=Chitinilyticum piscinae TaxID=2866724 RepID=A0A8J7K174_9NEIS|nr:pseudaminic acid cytidylyltransferase [Chitinilyticum piscinae]MBE9608816.1 pseudaminic acid cytidylyltransferase [Chitinilyticum piscinae]